MKTITNAGPAKLTKGQRLGRDIWRSRELYMFLIPGLILTFIFSYIPMYGIQIAWKQLRLGEPMTGGRWVGWKNFERFFSSSRFLEIMWNTISLNLCLLFINTPFAIGMALLMHNSSSKRLKSWTQTTTYLPNMVSMVIVVQLIELFTNPSSGLINILIKRGGGQAINFGYEPWFIPMYLISAIWQSAGYSSILYLSALSAIDQSIEEAARIDGASKLQRMWHIDLKLIIPTIATMMILNFGKILTAASMEKVLLMQTPVNIGASEILSTYTYQIGVISSQYGFGAATGLFNSVVNIAMLLVANFVSKKVAKTSLF